MVLKIKTKSEQDGYDQYKKFKLWKILEKAIEDLVKNQDLVEETDRFYIVGYIMKCIDKKNLLSK